MMADENIDDNEFQDWNNNEFTCNSEDINLFLSKLEQRSNLKVLRPKVVKSLVDSGNKLGLFNLFLPKAYINKIRVWTNQNLQSNGHTSVSVVQFNAYLGLELATSIVGMNRLKQYWSTKMFLGHKDFQRTMSRDTFLRIRTHLSLVCPNSVTAAEKSKDPLWHSRQLLEEFTKNCTLIAVHEGTAALDEASLATKARTKAKSYNPNKPAKFAIRFYAIVGNDGPYVFSIQDTLKGNTNSDSSTENFVQQFPEMRTVLNKTFDDQTEVKKDSPSALWTCMMSHATKKSEDPSGERVYFMDNFYTRHVLAKKVKSMTDGEARIIGTVKFTNIDGINRVCVKSALTKMKTVDRGTWCVVPAYNCPDNINELKRKHTNDMKKLDAKNRTPFIYPREKHQKEENAGYILWKDSKIVTFYSNCLKSTPSEDYMEGGSEDSNKCVQGLATLERWTGGESMRKTRFEVPAIIVAYNTYMSGVDRADQMRMVNPSQRKEKRLYMNVFTYVLDLAIVNAFTLFKNEAKCSDGYDISEFKRELCETLCKSFMETKDNGEDEVEDDIINKEDSIDSDIEHEVPAEDTDEQSATQVIDDVSSVDDESSEDEEEFESPVKEYVDPFADESTYDTTVRLHTQADDSNSVRGAIEMINQAKKKANDQSNSDNHNSGSSISTYDQVDLCRPVSGKLPENIAFVNEEFCAVGNHKEEHMLVANTGNNVQVTCYFCLITTGKRVRVNQGCTGCKRAYHTNCFTAFHCSNAIGRNMSKLSAIVHESLKKDNKKRKRFSKDVGNLDTFNLDFLRKHSKDTEDI